MKLLSVLPILLLLPAYWPERHQDPAIRRGHLDAVATAIDAACAKPPAPLSVPECTAALATLGDAETHFANFVIEGHCHGHQCDGGLARGPWQLHHLACPALWHTPRGSVAALKAGAKCAAVRFAAAKVHCHHGWIGAFAGYRSFNQCTWGPARGRAAEFRRMLALKGKT